MHRKAYAPSVLRYDRCLFQGVIDALNRVLSHGQEEAGGHLWLLCAGVKESGRRMREPLLAHEVVSLESCLQIVKVDADGASHEHVLGTLSDLTVDAK